MKTIQKIIDKSKEEIQSIYLHTNKYSNLNIMLRLLSGVKNNLLIRNSIGNVSSTTKKHVMSDDALATFRKCMSIVVESV